MLGEKEIKDIELKAEAIRETILEMLVAAGSGHTARHYVFASRGGLSEYFVAKRRRTEGK